MNERDFEFTDRDFKYIRQLVTENTGIVLGEHKRDMVYGRLVRRLKVHKIRRFSDYCDIIKSGDEQEMIELVNSLTTNLTSFFRENHHFEYLKKTVLPELMKINALTRRIRIWSAGCSTGEEPYSIAMVVNEVIPRNAGWDVRILATDLDSNVVAKASSGIYDISRVEGIDRGRTGKWMRKGRGDHAGSVMMGSELREMITFKQLNLLHDWPMKGPFDVIFCRNVVIYFDKDTQRVLFNRYADLMANHGTLFIGHSESLFKVSDRFKLIGQTMYNKV
ncbi:MAG: protein-glutamate O-methyltransferase CheR [Gammaproteobacteria bacterium]|nr:protein-glutamate O-methyltransferase CheR [Gammaproteobacteria bacterium]